MKSDLGGLGAWSFGGRAAFFAKTANVQGPNGN